MNVYIFELRLRKINRKTIHTIPENEIAPITLLVTTSVKGNLELFKLLPAEGVAMLPLLLGLLGFGFVLSHEHREVRTYCLS